MFECNTIGCEILSMVISSLAVILSGIATKTAHNAKKMTPRINPRKRSKKDAV